MELGEIGLRLFLLAVGVFGFLPGCALDPIAGLAFVVVGLGSAGLSVSDNL